MTNSESEKVVEWRSKLEDKSIHEVKEDLVSSATGIVSSASNMISSASEVISNAGEAVSNSSEFAANASELVANASDLVSNAGEVISDVKDSVKSKVTDFLASNPKDEVWEVPSIGYIIKSVFWGLLGYSIK